MSKGPQRIRGAKAVWGEDADRFGAVAEGRQPHAPKLATHGPALRFERPQKGRCVYEGIPGGGPR